MLSGQSATTTVHSLIIDAGWREVANTCLAWLDKQGL